MALYSNSVLNVFRNDAEFFSRAVLCFLMRALVLARGAHAAMVIMAVMAAIRARGIAITCNCNGKGQSNCHCPCHLEGGWHWEFAEWVKAARMELVVVLYFYGFQCANIQHEIIIILLVCLKTMFE